MIANSQSPGNHQFFKIAVQQKYNIKRNLVRGKRSVISTLLFDRPPGQKGAQKSVFQVTTSLTMGFRHETV
ncbi:hypothetical protein [Gaoshiqia sediminis]|uniref:Uncharacterized protein n=1 Tax=Gaoshiqia sediminis TaxID=2986998 RepID=A0AA41YBT3_9BACT|nr:hypothetical protein [Gaoshiqia sediminis]MCW0481902.1 hypothetical protein [Gaoshiqia sediminis]